MSRIAIVAALEREIRLLLRHPTPRDWTLCDKEYSGRSFRFFECADAVVVCGGIGPEAARRATQAIIALYSPNMIYSAGFAGAADETMKVGEIFIPRCVVNANDGSSIDTGIGEGVLVTFACIASPQQKSNLAASFQAQAIDMEASAVAQAADARGVPFAAVKAISDTSDFAFPPMENFITSTGQFRTSEFALFLALRPWLWPSAFRLARDTAKAARALSTHLNEIMESHATTTQPARTEIRQ